MNTTASFDVPNDLHPETAELVRRFATALAAKLKRAQDKYGYSDGWASPDWRAECAMQLRAHVEKGDPIDVAAYCAFQHHHGWGTLDAGYQLPAYPPADADTSVWYRQRVRLRFQYLEAIRDIEVEVSGGLAGMAAIEAALSEVYTAVVAGPLEFTYPNGDTVTRADEHRLGRRWLEAMLVEASIQSIEPLDSLARAMKEAGQDPVLRVSYADHGLAQHG